jgi:hypothetical protein
LRRYVGERERIVREREVLLVKKEELCEYI